MWMGRQAGWLGVEPLLWDYYSEPSYGHNLLEALWRIGVLPCLGDSSFVSFDIPRSGLSGVSWRAETLLTGVLECLDVTDVRLGACNAWMSQIWGWVHTKSPSLPLRDALEEEYDNITQNYIFRDDGYSSEFLLHRSVLESYVCSLLNANNFH